MVELPDFSDQSRVWIYTANRKLSKAESINMNALLESFAQRWVSHNRALKAHGQIIGDLFVLLVVDETQAGASGCSIDDSVGFIQQLEKDYNVDLLDKMNVSYKQGEFIAFNPLADFRKMAKYKAVSKKTIVFNNLVTNIAEYKENWEVPASESWHSRFLK